MSKLTTSIRLDQNLHKQVAREAEKAGLSFSAIVQLLLRAYAKGSVHIGVTQYSHEYLEAIGKEADALRQSRKGGKAKSYASSKALFDDILSR
jgi:antitoxin component of RelBE/YafQ-DinJ toxin-antitoxin module